MADSNYNVSVKFEEAKTKAKEMEEAIIGMQSLLNELDESVNAMTWNGAKANEFKTKISQYKEELDDIYRNYVKVIPEQIETSINKYKSKEES